MDSAHDLNALFSREPSGLSFPGPFRVHEVVLHEHQVPFLHALPREDGGIHLRLDDRFTLDLDVAEAERFIPFSRTPSPLLLDTSAILGPNAVNPGGSPLPTCSA
jgi:hypothetical protein